jgi:hypothetical protein
VAVKENGHDQAWYDDNGEWNEEEEDTDEELVADNAPTSRAPTSRSAKSKGSIFSATTFFFALAALPVVTGASGPPCELPLNCGEFNNSKVCGHTFSGCDVCDTCCHSWLKPVDICDGCVQDECTSGRHPDCCVSFDCDIANGQCKRAFRATGAYPNSSACEKACSAPASVCTGSSADLASADCNAWRSFSLDPLYREWIEGICDKNVHTDPCSCNIHTHGHVKCDVASTYKRITEFDMGARKMPPSGGIPTALLDLTGLTLIRLGENELLGTIPTAIGQLTALVELVLDDNNFSGTVRRYLKRCCSSHS